MINLVISCASFGDNQYSFVVEKVANSGAKDSKDRISQFKLSTSKY